MKVLIVDDDKYVWMGLKKLIPWVGIGFTEVLCADNGSTAYDIAIENYPDLIITDVRMPIMNGIELCRLIYEAKIETYIIMLSAYDEFDFVRSALTYNVKDYILKPLDDASISQLTAKIKSIATELNYKNNLRNVVYDKKLRNRILNALYESDIDYINNFFLYDLTSMQLKQNDYKDFCLFLIDCLFDYLQNIEHGDSAIINAQRDDAINYALDARDYLDIANYTFKLFVRTINALLPINQEFNLLVKEICNYIEENYMYSDLTVTKIASVYNIVPGYVGSLFKKHKGIRINSYINKLRVEKACAYLEDVSLKVSEVGSMVGISDSNYFPKIFRRIKGVSPTQYRNVYARKS